VRFGGLLFMKKWLLVAVVAVAIASAVYLKWAHPSSLPWQLRIQDRLARIWYSNDDLTESVVDNMVDCLQDLDPDHDDEQQCVKVVSAYAEHLISISGRASVGKIGVTLWKGKRDDQNRDHYGGDVDFSWSDGRFADLYWYVIDSNPWQYAFDHPSSD
jgi:hypothetical protein